jgi:calcineurin-like phosphoesterase family protein
MKITEHIHVISDLHFGHANIMELMGRPEGYNEMIIDGWNSVVNKHDKVLVLGDVTFVNKVKTKAYFDQLKGMKYLVRGNHDGHGERWFKDVGFIEIMDGQFKRFKNKYDEYQTVVFTHRPVLDLPDTWYNIHGHLHGNDHRGEHPSTRHFDVSVEPMNYKPMRIYEVLKELNELNKI